MPSRRLEDSIRELCAAVIEAKDAEIEPALSELKVALHEHTERLRNLAAATHKTVNALLAGVPEPTPTGNAGPGIATHPSRSGVPRIGGADYSAGLDIGHQLRLSCL